MADEKDFVEDGAPVIEIEDADGNTYLYEEEMILPVDGEQYAILVGIHDDEEDAGSACGCGCEDGDEDVIVAKILTNAHGEEEYVEPTEEEFERFQAAYDELVEESEED
ncbi:DUF1292 domain-containing protein [uncultured Selenomonas sp.]|jgi:hypothetical protein|uniref:DUF1292 domain-containing protein n=1 Tax=uncultured Selenomonas sp. TaxID=159275 RepID=UPI0025F3FD12|nr:DUF1292 domain-containing protein [uncultured Selenomonas sp.]